MFTLFAEEKVVMLPTGALVVRGNSWNFHDTDLAFLNKLFERPINSGDTQAGKFFLSQ